MTMSNTLEIIAPAAAEHRDALIDLSAKIFNFGGVGGYFDIKRHIEEGYWPGSHYDAEVSRIAVVEGQVVAHYGVWGYPMRVGSAALRCGGIGAVFTHPNHRKKGYLMKTAQASIDAMRTGGYDLTLLFGINNFYDRLGYVRAFSDETVTIEVAALPTEKPASAARKFKPVRRADTDALANRTFAGLTGTAVRPTFTRAGMIRGEGYRWLGPRGRLAGYVYVEHDPAERRLRCYEATGDPEQALRVLGRLARRFDADAVALVNQPRRSAVMRAVWQRRIEVVTPRNPNGGPMARLLNLSGALGPLVGELRARLRASAMSRWTGTLVIDDGAGRRAALRITRRGVAVVEAAGGAVGRSPHTVRCRGHAVQLVLGTEAGEALLRETAMTASGDAAGLVAALFPAQEPALLPFDRF